MDMEVALARVGGVPGGMARVEVGIRLRVVVRMVVEGVGEVPGGSSGTVGIPAARRIGFCTVGGRCCHPRTTPRTIETRTPAVQATTIRRRRSGVIGR